MPNYQRRLIVGAGAGLSASLAPLLSRNGLAVTLAARDIGKLADLAAGTGADTMACDVARSDDVARLFAALDAGAGRLGHLQRQPPGPRSISPSLIPRPSPKQ